MDVSRQVAARLVVLAITLMRKTTAEAAKRAPLQIL
jgi:hypothetical protein